MVLMFDPVITSLNGVWVDHGQRFKIEVSMF